MRQARSIEHHTVYCRPGRYAGWPANYGMWCWGRELVVVFAEGTFKRGLGGHKRDTTQPFSTLQGRSLDGGRTWRTEPFIGPTPGNRAICADEHMVPDLRIGNPYTGEHPPMPLEGPLDFTDPETVLLVGRTTCESLPNDVHSWFHVSRDRGRCWAGPYRFVGLDEGLLLAGRTDVVRLGPRRALLMLTCHKRDGHEGRVLCAQTTDGGRTFGMRSWVSPERTDGFEIMPSTQALTDGRLVSATRVVSGGSGHIAVHESTDSGATWRCLASSVAQTGAHGNPPALALLPGARLGLVYGYRGAPFGIRAKLSDDGGRSWGEEIALRTDGGDADLGYPRVAFTGDGLLVAAYYYNTQIETERFIGASVWDPRCEAT